MCKKILNEYDIYWSIYHGKGAKFLERLSKYFLSIKSTVWSRFIYRLLMSLGKLCVIIHYEGVMTFI